VEGEITNDINDINDINDKALLGVQKKRGEIEIWMGEREIVQQWRRYFEISYLGEGEGMQKECRYVECR
jgi:hypothetical protein